MNIFKSFSFDISIESTLLTKRRIFTKRQNDEETQLPKGSFIVNQFLWLFIYQ